MSKPTSPPHSHSRSHSPTPSPISPPPNIHQHVQEGYISHTGQSTSAPDGSFLLRTIHPGPPLNTAPPISSHNRSIRPAEGNIHDSRMTKRFRPDPSITAESLLGQHYDAQHSAASSSPTGNRAAQGEQSVTRQTGALQKKKRTRTLTTPQQAAVLHGLLAQSRFPTTAMREEVGRSIGLSARKVQIWFQNQRQKAKRPRHQGESDSNHPPPYSAFPSTPHYGASSSVSRPEAGPSQLLPPAPGGSHSLRLASSSTSPELYTNLPDPHPQLLGPGVPGLELHQSNTAIGMGTSGSFIGHPDMEHAVGGPSRRSSPVSLTQGRPYPTTLNYPSYPQDPYRTLPPLARTSQTGISSSLSGSGTHPAAGQLLLIDGTVLPVATERPFIHYRPHQGPGLPPISTVDRAPSGSIPPPFTLQPPPQWDARSFAPSLSRSNIWSSPSPLSASSSSPTQTHFVPSTVQPLLTSVSVPNLRRAISAERGLTAEDVQREQQSTFPSPPQKRMGRYDPVRATVIRTSPPPPSPPTSSS